MRVKPLARRRPPPLVRRYSPGLALRRHPALWWGLVLVCSLVLGAAVASVTGRAEQARREWGDTVTVVVAESDLAAGQALDREAVSLEARPAGVVPRHALTEVPTDAVARADIVAGEVVVSSRLAPHGLEGVAAMLPAGTRAVAIPLEPGLAPPLRVGDRVDVLVALGVDAEVDGPPGFEVATDALVVAVEEAAATVAVARRDAPRVAVALGSGAVSLALIGAG